MFRSLSKLKREVRFQIYPAACETVPPVVPKKKVKFNVAPSLPTPLLELTTLLPRLNEGEMLNVKQLVQDLLLQSQSSGGLVKPVLWEDVIKVDVLETVMRLPEKSRFVVREFVCRILADDLMEILGIFGMVADCRRKLQAYW